LHCSPNVIRVKNDMGWTCSMLGGDEKCTQKLGGKPEGKRPLGGPRHRWEDNTGWKLKKYDTRGCTGFT